jgi:hypothetical protein
MFEVPNQYKTMPSEWINISDNFHVFHFDEFPILYAGTNYLGNKIIGSLAHEDDENDLFRYFHFIVSNKQYNDFVKRKISYRNLIFSIGELFIIDKYISGSIANVYHAPVDALPLDYLPLENVFCPNVERAIGFDYTVSLQGGMADLHEAFSSTIASVGKSADKILNRLGNALKIKLLNPHVYQLPSIEGSFELKFRVKVDDTGLFYKEEYLKNYFQLCLNYSINTLPAEAKQLTIGDISDTVFEKEIIPSAVAIYESFSYKMEESYIEALKANFLEAVDDIDAIGSQVGKGFNAVEFSGIDAKNNDVSIGYIDKQYAEEITAISQYIEALPHKGEASDESYQDYRILVYDLNTDTRNGTAHIANIADADIMENPKIKVEGDADLAGSIFTESLHFNKWIVVKAKAKMINGKVRSLSIFFEE